jgi:hypothetical protein
MVSVDDAMTNSGEVLWFSGEDRERLGTTERAEMY